MYLAEELILAIFKKMGSMYGIEAFSRMTLINEQWNRISLDRKLKSYKVCYNCNRNDEDHVGCLIYSNYVYQEDQLFSAAQLGHCKVVKYLCEIQKANVHADNDCAVRLASQYGHCKVVTYLCEIQKADVHANNDLAVRLASSNGHLEVVKYLCEIQKANVHANNDCAFNGHHNMDIVKLLNIHF